MVEGEKIKKVFLSAVAGLWLGILGVFAYSAIADSVTVWFLALPPSIQLGVQITLILCIAGVTFTLFYPRAKHLLWRFIRSLAGATRTYLMVTGGNIGVEVCQALDTSAKELGKEGRSLRTNTGIIDFPPNSAFGFKSRFTHSVPMLHVPLKAGGKSYSAAVASRHDEERKVRRKTIGFRKLFLPINVQQTIIGFDVQRGKTCLSAMDAYQRWLCDQPRPKVHLIMVVTGEDPNVEVIESPESQPYEAEAEQLFGEAKLTLEGDVANE